MSTEQPINCKTKLGRFSQHVWRALVPAVVVDHVILIALILIWWVRCPAVDIYKEHHFRFSQRTNTPTQFQVLVVGRTKYTLDRYLIPWLNKTTLSRNFTTNTYVCNTCSCPTERADYYAGKLTNSWRFGAKNIPPSLKLPIALFATLFCFSRASNHLHCMPRVLWTLHVQWYYDPDKYSGVYWIRNAQRDVCVATFRLAHIFKITPSTVLR